MDNSEKTTATQANNCTAQGYEENVVEQYKRAHLMKGFKTTNPPQTLWGIKFESLTPFTS